MKTKHRGRTCILLPFFLKLYGLYLLFRVVKPTVNVCLFSPPKFGNQLIRALRPHQPATIRQRFEGVPWHHRGGNYFLFVDLWRVTGAHHDAALWSRGGSVGGGKPIRDELEVQIFLGKVVSQLRFKIEIIPESFWIQMNMRRKNGILSKILFGDQDVFFGKIDYKPRQTFQT